MTNPTRKELYAIAAKHNIPKRSGMNREQLLSVTRPYRRKKILRNRIKILEEKIGYKQDRISQSRAKMNQANRKYGMDSREYDKLNDRFLNIVGGMDDDIERLKETKHKLKTFKRKKKKKKSRQTKLKF